MIISPAVCIQDGPYCSIVAQFGQFLPSFQKLHEEGAFGDNDANPGTTSKDAVRSQKFYMF